MFEALWLSLALLANVLGLAWLALTLDAHWRQLRGAQPRPAAAVPLLRGLGYFFLLLSALFCLLADHPSMAVLVWVMALALSALIVTFTFTYRPRLFAPLVAWVRG